MLSPGARREVRSLLTLDRTRSTLLEPRYRALVGSVGLAYAVGTMVIGGMLYFSAQPLRTGWFFLVYPSGPGPSWTYPAILAGGPMFQVDVPLGMGILLTLAAAGIGLGMSLAVYLGVRLVRRNAAGLRGVGTGGAAVGLAPVMFALVTMGACCSTVTAATAGVSLAAQSTGSSPSAALANAWYLGVIQVVVVYVALVVQEQLLRNFGGELTAPRPKAARTAATPTTSRLSLGRASGLALRVVLVVAGLTWALAIVSEEFTLPRAHLTGWTVVGGLLQHVVPGLLAVLVALFPQDALRVWERHGKGAFGLLTRGTLLVAGVSVLTWVPPAVAQSGAGALGNELLAFWQFPASWGAVSPPIHDPGGLMLRWGFQFILLGALAIATGISPQRVLKFVIPPSIPSVPRVAGGRLPNERAEAWMRIPSRPGPERPGSNVGRG